MQIKMLNDKTYTIVFSHPSEEMKVQMAHLPSELSSIFTQRSTTCAIHDGVLVKGVKSEPIATGVAKVSPNDQFCKETGRRFALDRALLPREPVMINGKPKRNRKNKIVYRSLPSQFSKTDRMEIWNAYFAR